MFSWLIRWASSDLGSATEAIFTSVSTRNSTLPVKSLLKRCLLAPAVWICFCGWPDLLTQFTLLATILFERTQGWCRCSYPSWSPLLPRKILLLILRPAEILCKGLLVHAQVSTLATCYTGRQWTWPCEGDVHLANTSGLHSAEVQTLGGSQAEIPFGVLFLLAPEAARADQDISLNIKYRALSLSPTLQETAMQIPTWGVIR